MKKLLPISARMLEVLALIGKNHNLTKKEIALSLDLSESNFSLWASGESRKPGIRTIRKFTTVYNVNENYILHGEGEQFRGGPSGHPEARTEGKGIADLDYRVKRLEGQFDGLDSDIRKLFSLSSEEKVLLALFRNARSSWKGIALGALRSGQGVPGEPDTSDKSHPGVSPIDQKSEKPGKHDPET